MTGGKTKNHGAPQPRRPGVFDFSQLRSGVKLPAVANQRFEPQQVVEIFTDITDRKHAEYRLQQYAEQSQLDKFIAPELHRHFARLYRGRYPELDDRQGRLALREALEAIPDPRPSYQQVIDNLRRSYLPQIKKTLLASSDRQLTEQFSAQEKKLVWQAEEMISKLTENYWLQVEPSAERLQHLNKLIKDLEYHHVGTRRAVPRPDDQAAPVERYIEALEHALRAAGNLINIAPGSADEVQVIENISNFVVKIQGRDPQYRRLGLGMAEPQLDPQALAPFWDKFVSSCR